MTRCYEFEIKNSGQESDKKEIFWLSHSTVQWLNNRCVFVCRIQKCPSWYSRCPLQSQSIGCPFGLSCSTCRHSFGVSASNFKHPLHSWRLLTVAARLSCCHGACCCASVVPARLIRNLTETLGICWLSNSNNDPLVCLFLVVSGGQCAFVSFYF